MSRLSLAERARILAISAKRSQRASRARVMYSPLLRWTFGSPHMGQLLIVPQDLRTADPSFWQELRLDQFGLAGTVAPLRGVSPFALRPPNLAWARALHGFGWLRHLEAADDQEAKLSARRLAVEWTIRQGLAPGPAWEPGVAGRRIISWLSHANLLLDGADAETYDVLTSNLAAQIVRLAASWRDGPDGYPRLLALTALMLADLCISGHDRRLTEVERMFVAEIERQILEDGGHVSRNPVMLVELLLDLLPARQCFAARGLTPPEALLSAMRDMVALARFMRLGDGRLARFNGVSVAAPASLATVLAYDDQPRNLLGSATPSGYVRLPRGSTVVIADAGSAPPLEFAGEAHAGCLSFEMSAGSRPVLVNGGAPGPADHEWRAVSRSTSAHNTLCLAEMSSARLIRHAGLESLIGGAPVSGPPHVHSDLQEINGELIWTARHDGYYDRTGLVHHRRLAVSASGARVAGIDRLMGSTGAMRLRNDLPFAIHFHLHPDISCRLAGVPGEVEIATPEAETWRFSAEGAELCMEDSTFFADSSGPRRTLQIVLRGTTHGESLVQWQIEKRA